MASNQTLVPVRYRVDFDTLAQQMLPSLLRRPRLIAWLRSLLTPLRQLYTDFITYTRYAQRELSYNGQTMILEGALNDGFDSGVRRITVSNTDTELLPLYINFSIELEPEKPVRFASESPPWLYVPAFDEFNTQLDFIVRAPSILYTPERARQLHARIQRFKPATRRYSLRFI
jgi:hypothetical protein